MKIKTRINLILNKFGFEIININEYTKLLKNDWEYKKIVNAGIKKADIKGNITINLN